MFTCRSYITWHINSANQMNQHSSQRLTTKSPFRHSNTLTLVQKISVLLRRGLYSVLVHKHGSGEISKPSPYGFRQVHVEGNRRESVATKADLLLLRWSSCDGGVFLLPHTLLRCTHAELTRFLECIIRRKGKLCGFECYILVILSIFAR